MSGARFAVSVILSVLAILGTQVRTHAADDRPRTNAVLDGQFAAQPVNVMQRTCEGEDGTYLEIRGTFAGTVTSSDDRLSGDLELRADALINVSPKGLGTFQGPFEISDPMTGKRKARRASWRSSMAIDRLAHPAVVVVDMQNDFVRVGAPLEVAEARATIPAHQALLAACRARAIPVIYTKFVAGPERTLIWEWSPVLAPPVCCCWKGFLRHYEDVGKELDCSDIVNEIYPEPGDPIVDKFGYGAASASDQDE